MYHSIMLFDMLELLELSSHDERLKALYSRWARICNKGINWSLGIRHNDGDIPHFNDTSLNFAPSIPVLVNYFKSLGHSPDLSYIRSKTFRDTGFTRLCSKNSLLLINHAPIEPSYQPGHAHADSLSFELSIDSHRVFVNTGTSVYGNNERRQYERSTPAHNTVMINGQNSSDVWGGFRVAKRAQIISEKISLKNNYCSFILKDAQKNTHERRYELGSDSLIIEDRINGGGVAFLHLASQISIIKACQCALLLSFGKYELNVESSCAIIIKDSLLAPEYGKLIPSKMLEIPFDRNLQINITWYKKHA